MAFTPVKPPPPIILRSVLTKTNQILSSHSRLFISLTLLFILPSSIITSGIPLLHLQTQTTPIISIIYTAVMLCVSLITTGTVTFSAYQILSDRDVKLVASIKSLKRSFFPLLITSMCSMLVLIAIIFGFSLCVFFIFLVGFGILVEILVGILGFEITRILDPSDSLNIGVIILAAIIVFALVMYFKVNIALSSVIAAVEFSYGFQPLRRSTYLVKGTRRVILQLMLIYQIITGLPKLVIWFSRGDNGDLTMMKNWMFFCGIVMSVVLNVMVTLHYLVAITVMYMCCKSVHGEFAGHEVSDKVAGEYVCVPFDDGKLEHGVYLMSTWDGATLLSQGHKNVELIKKLVLFGDVLRFAGILTFSILLVSIGVLTFAGVLTFCWCFNIFLVF